MERPRVRSSVALIQVEASFFINTKNKFGFFICQVHGFLSGLNYSLEPQKKKSMPPGLFTDTPIRHFSYTFSCLVCCLCPLPIRAPFGLNSYQEANGNGKALHTEGQKVINSFYV